MATQDDVLAQLAEAKALAVETQKDVLRVIDKLDAAAQAGDLTAVSDAITELRGTIATTDAAAEAAAPETPPTP